MNLRNPSAPDLDSGIVYSRSYFPDHPVNSILKRMDFTTRDINGQYQHLRDSLKLNFLRERCDWVSESRELPCVVRFMISMFEN